MVTCEICGKQVKTAQALRGHNTFVHGMVKPNNIAHLQSEVLATNTLEQNVVNADQFKRSSLSEKSDALEARLETLEGQQAELLNDVEQSTKDIGANTRREVERARQLALDLVMNQLGPIQSRLGSLEAKHSTLKALSDSLKRNVESIDRRLRKLEPPVCVMPTKDALTACRG